eukprot:g8075.t1
MAQKGRSISPSNFLTEAIVYANGKAVGRLVRPLLEATSTSKLLQSFQFTFQNFHPAKQSRASGAINFTVDSEFRQTQFQIQLFGSFGNSNFALPFKYQFPGREAAASLSIHLQRLQYINQHKTNRGEELHPVNQVPASTSEVQITCGSGIESCIAVFHLSENSDKTEDDDGSSIELLPVLKTFILSFIILNPAASATKVVTTEKNSTVEIQSSEMEAVLTKKTTSTDSKDFAICAESTAFGVHKTTPFRKKKTKKKSKSANKANQSLDPTRNEGNYPLVDKVLETLDPRKKPQQSSKNNGNNKSSKLMKETSSQESSISSNQHPHFIDMNDFDEDEVYIRRNRSNVSLDNLQQNSNSVQDTNSGQNVNSVHNSSSVQNVNSPQNMNSLQNANSVKTVSFVEDVKLVQNAKSKIGDSGGGNRVQNKRMPVQSPALQTSAGMVSNRLNFRAANGLLQTNGAAQTNIQRLGDNPVYAVPVPGQYYCIPGLSPYYHGPPTGAWWMNGGLEVVRKTKDEVFDHSSCFYFRASNDLDRFLTHTTPLLQLDSNLDPNSAMDCLTLSDVWQFYYEASMLGKEVPLETHQISNPNGASFAYYLPYLSGMQLFVSDEGNDTSECFICDIDGWPRYMQKQYEHFEVNPPWFRRPLYDLMDELTQEEPELATMKLRDLHPASWFCVAWYPLYRIPDAPLLTRFLTFHSFHPPHYESSLVSQGGRVPLAVYGLEWYDMKDDLWINNIKTTKGSQSSSPSKSTDTKSFINEGEFENAEQLHWLYRIRELRFTAKLFSRGLSFQRQSQHGLMDVNTYHHDFEYFYERN